MKTIKCWTQNFPRPIGVEPIVYLTKPTINPITVRRNGVTITDPYTVPEIIEHATILGALSYIAAFSWTCGYLKELKIK